jgi:hypothetical protein
LTEKESKPQAKHDKLRQKNYNRLSKKAFRIPQTILDYLDESKTARLPGATEIEKVGTKKADALGARKFIR